jgi:hypothetical protein
MSFMITIRKNNISTHCLKPILLRNQTNDIKIKIRYRPMPFMSINKTIVSKVNSEIH